ncbi:MAG TPA: sigma factor, partial [Kofleriaceae bacterium]|nr:sigma factor [Kofleriaceae bacterium]
MAVAPLPPPATPPAAAELDEVTLRRAQRGDADAGRALVERYQGAVFALLGRMLGGVRRGAIEDLAQDTFLAVFAALPRFRPDGSARL